MSYLEMPATPLNDTSKMVISLWFRDVSKQQPDPPAGPGPTPSVAWPQGFWTSGNSGTVMVPPNAQFSISQAEFQNCIFFWNSYGIPNDAEFFGDAFLGPASVWIPNPPPVPLNTMSTPVSATGAVADVDMSPFGIRTLLAFGDPGIQYNYYPWAAVNPGVIPAVEIISANGFINDFQPDVWPPPYPPYDKSVGDNGLFYPRTFKIGAPAGKGNVPQSFIGIDNDGHIVINLQTSTTATYRGMAFQQSKLDELYVTATTLVIDGPPRTYTQVGFPFPDGHWVAHPGYWTGYQYEYEDISQQVMGCAPENFLIFATNVPLLDFAFQAPVVTDGGWHHLLFSFDISGNVTADLTDNSNPIIRTSCKAWLALDDVNVTGVNLQNRPPCHDGFTLPKLRGTETTQLLDCGPCGTYSRTGIGLGPNDILPRNAWLHGWNGNPKDGLTWFSANASRITPGDLCYTNEITYGGKDGDFSWINYTGSLWPLYGHGVAPGPWQATFQPPHPTVPDPSTFSPPFYSGSGYTIPLRGHPIAIPARSDASGMLGNNAVAYNTGVEMAELQIWIDKSIDTGDESMRRLFLDYPKDNHGNVIIGAPLQPVAVAVAAAALGQPDILLHGSNNWIAGRNSGKSGIATDPQTGKKTILPGGQFTRTAIIKKFKPDPKLGE